MVSSYGKYSSCPTAKKVNSNTFMLCILGWYAEVLGL